MPAASPFCPFSPFIRPPSADGRTARRAPARNFSTSRAASSRKSQKNRGPPPPLKPPKIRTSAYIREKSYIHFRTSFLQLGGCEGETVPVGRTEASVQVKYVLGDEHFLALGIHTPGAVIVVLDVTLAAYSTDIAPLE